MASLQWGFDVTLLLGGLIYAGAWIFSGLGWEPGEL
jgi:hypothetical protein